MEMIGVGTKLLGPAVISKFIINGKFRKFGSFINQTFYFLCSNFLVFGGSDVLRVLLRKLEDFWLVSV